MADFTFPPATPTTAAAATTAEPPAVVVVASPLPSAACSPLPFPRFPVPAASSSSSPPPWFPPSASPPATAAPPPVTTRSRALTVTLTAMAAAAQQGPPPGAGGGDAASAAAAVAEEEEVEDRMDLLWEDFNEELARGGSCSCRAASAGLQARDLWPSDSSDAESEPAAAARGCAPVLRPSSRAAGAVRSCRRRAGTWVLLMRIFRRLFVVDKTRDRLRGRQAPPRRCRDDGELVAMPACLAACPPAQARRLPP